MPCRDEDGWHTWQRSGHPMVVPYFPSWRNREVENFAKSSILAQLLFTTLRGNYVSRTRKNAPYWRIILNEDFLLRNSWQIHKKQESILQQKAHYLPQDIVQYFRKVCQLVRSQMWLHLSCSMVKCLNPCLQLRRWKS